MKRSVGIGLILAVSVIVFIQCDRYEFPESPYPGIETLPLINISEEGVTFQAKVTRMGKKPVIDHGFVWGLQENFSINNRQKVSLGDLENVGLFEADVMSGLYADTTYFVKAFIQTDSYFVYGKPVSFTSKGSTPPMITYLTPAEGTWGDTVKISGSYFSTVPSNNVVKFGSIDAKVITSTDSTLHCIVPEGIAELQAPLSVSVSGNQSAPTPFRFTIPRIDHFAPTEGTFGEVVTIAGANFRAGANTNTVMFNDKAAEVIEASRSLIKVRVPHQIMSRENEVTVTLNLQSAKANGVFRISPPSITGISSNEGNVNGTVEIAGDNFNPTAQGNILLFGKNPVRILSASRQSLTVEIPDGNYKERTNSFELTVAEQTVMSTATLMVKDAWIRKADSPPTDWPVITFGIDGKGYALSGDKTWRYNPGENTWEQIALYPGEKKLDQLSFVINNMGYVGMGSSRSGNGQTEFWRFNPVTNAWTRIADFPFEDSSGAVALSAGGKGYIATGFSAIGLWEYDPLTDAWGRRGGDLNAHLPGYPHRADAGFTIGDRLFLYLADETAAPNPLFEFDLLTNEWISKGQPEENDYLQNKHTTGFSVQEKGYIRGYKNLYVFDPNTNNWQIRSADRLGALYFAKSFVIDNKAYVVGAYLGDRYSLWEYDPAYDLP